MGIVGWLVETMAFVLVCAGDDVGGFMSRGGKETRRKAAEWNDPDDSRHVAEYEGDGCDGEEEGSHDGIVSQGVPRKKKDLTGYS